MRKLLTLGAVLLLGCGCASSPKVYAFRAERLEPEAWYERLHVIMEKCMGQRRDYGDIEWLVTRPGIMGSDGEALEDGRIAGKWSAPERIFLDARFVMHRGVLLHELGHYITQRGEALHDDPLFQACVSL